MPKLIYFLRVEYIKIYIHQNILLWWFVRMDNLATSVQDSRGMSISSKNDGFEQILFLNYLTISYFLVCILVNGYSTFWNKFNM
jgi:hypothetical protein